MWFDRYEFQEKFDLLESFISSWFELGMGLLPQEFKLKNNEACCSLGVFCWQIVPSLANFYDLSYEMNYVNY